MPGSRPQIFVIGPKGSGKSSLLRKLAGVRPPRNGKEIGLGQNYRKILSAPSYRNQELPAELTDLHTQDRNSNQSAYETLLKSRISEASLIVIVVDINSPNVKLEVETCIKDIKDRRDGKDVPMMCALNKTDLPQLGDIDRRNKVDEIKSLVNGPCVLTDNNLRQGELLDSFFKLLPIGPKSNPVKKLFFQCCGEPPQEKQRLVQSTQRSQRYG